jgi:signal transduction histidine kinase
VLRRIPIRAKVAGALALPLVGLVAAVIIGVSAINSVSESISRQTGLASASVGHAGLIGALQDERNQALIEMLGLGNALVLEVPDTPSARARTDAASTALHHSISGQSGRLRDDYAAAMESLAALPDLRAQADAAIAGPGLWHREAAHAVFTGYTEIVSTLFASHDRFSLEVVDPEIRQGDDLVHYGSHATDAVAQLVERLVYLGTGPGGVDQPVEAAEIAALRRDVERNNTAVQVRGVGDYAGAAENLGANPRVSALPDLADEVIAESRAVDPAGLLAVTPLGPDGGYPAFRDSVVAVLDARVDQLQADADARRRLYVGGAVALVLAAVLIAWLVSRSITRPLRDLSVKARAMATYRLPVAVQDILEAPPGEDLVVPDADPIRVRARDEVADVARAFNDVQESAIGLAVEQAALRRNVAESYVNLGRRNQNLLSRLLDVVGELEHEEHDPKHLAKLYKLDHLATRIRRNAESLLVLSNASTAATWQPPVPVSDVVRAALGEVENYERVLVRTLAPAMVLGGASADLAHLLAELIENGLRHSPPRELVEVSGVHGPDGYTLTIIDHGLGMTPEEIDRANQRLAGAESLAVTPARYLGHYVTAVLAARHGVKVSLRGSVVVGIAAVVELPAALITEQPGEALSASTVAPFPVPPPPPPPPPRPAPRGFTDVRFVPDPEVEHVGPTAEAVRTAVAILQGTPPQPTTTPATSAPRAIPATVAPPQAHTGHVVEATPPPPPPPAPFAPPTRWPATPPAGLALPSPGPGRPAEAAPTPAPARTASGLVRRVRGANVPVGAAATRGVPGGLGAGIPPDEASSGAVDGAEIQRFLTNLVDGVQRSLDEQGTAGPGDER